MNINSPSRVRTRAAAQRDHDAALAAVADAAQQPDDQPPVLLPPVGAAADAAPTPEHLAAALFRATTAAGDSAKRDALIAEQVPLIEASLKPYVMLHPHNADYVAKISVATSLLVDTLSTTFGKASVLLKVDNASRAQHLCMLVGDAMRIALATITTTSPLANSAHANKVTDFISLLEGHPEFLCMINHYYARTIRPWANILREMLGAYAVSAPAWPTTPTPLSEWVQINTPALLEYRGAIVDAAAAHFDAVQAADVRLQMTTVASRNGGNVAAAALIAAPAVDVARGAIIAAAEHSVDLQLLRDVQRRVDAGNPDSFKKALQTLHELVVPASGDGMALLNALCADTFSKLKLAAADRSATSKQQPKNSTTYAISSVTDEPGSRALLAADVQIDGALHSHVVDTAAQVTCATTAFLEALPASSVRRPIDVTPEITPRAWDGSTGAALTPGWSVLARTPWNPRRLWYTVYATDRLANGPMLWGVDSLRQTGATLRVGLRPADDVIGPLDNRNDERERPLIATLSPPDPMLDGEDGRLTATELPSPGVQYAFECALDVALARIAAVPALQDRPDQVKLLQDAARGVTWSSKQARPPAQAPPAIKGFELRSRLLPGPPPTFRAGVPRFSAEQRKSIDAQVAAWLENGTFVHVSDDSAMCTSPLMSAAKFDPFRNLLSRRTCGDFRKPNSYIEPDHELLPLIVDMQTHLSRGLLRSTYDLAAAYTQFRIDETTARIYTVQASRELKIRPARAAFGMRNAGSLTQRALKTIFSDGNASVENYSDEILQAHVTDRIEPSVAEVIDTFRRASENNVVFNADKLNILQEELDSLGATIGNGTIRMQRSRMQAIAAWPEPQTPSQLVSFLAMASHYRPFIPGFAIVASTLRREVLHERRLTWTTAGRAAFLQLRERFEAAATLQAIELGRPFIVGADASKDGLSYTIAQNDDDGVPRLVACGGRLRGQIWAARPRGLGRAVRVPPRAAPAHRLGI